MFGVLPENVLERLARASQVVKVAGGQTVFVEGDQGDLFYIIESGSIDITIRGEYIRTLSAGDSFGEIALLRNVPRTATITATADLVARIIERDHFLRAVTGHGDATDEAEAVITRWLTTR